MTAQAGKGKIQCDLLTPLEGENWLLERLKDHGIDVYVDIPFETLRDRLAHAITSYGYGPVVAGRHNGKPETYEQLFERLYSAKLKNVAKALRQSSAERARQAI